MFYTNEEDMTLENRISRNTGRILHDLDLICCCFDELGRINTEDIYTGLAGTSGRDALNNLNEKLFPSVRGYDICFGEFISSADRFLAKDNFIISFCKYTKIIVTMTDIPKKINSSIIDYPYEIQEYLRADNRVLHTAL